MFYIKNDTVLQASGILIAFVLGQSQWGYHKVQDSSNLFCIPYTKNQGVFVKHYSMPPAATKSNQSCQKDNIARRRQPYVNSNNKQPLQFRSHSPGQFFFKVGQPARSRSIHQKSWYSAEGLATRNAHVKYESPTSSG